MKIAALISMSFLSFLAAAPNLATKPAPAASQAPSQAPLSKYERARREQVKASAPADQYFGKLQMSYLGINNTFHDAAIMSGDHTTEPAIVNKVGFADEALREWSRHFPHDPQLARTYYLAIRADQKIWLKPNQEKAWIYMNRIVDLFPSSYFGKLIKRDLAIGFTEHYYADAAPCPTPTPTPIETPTPIPSSTESPRRGRRQPTPTPMPTPTPEPTATPSPEPTPTPSPRAISKGLKVQIIDPPCFQPPTPGPSPTATETPSAAPFPAASPSPGASPAIPSVLPPGPTSQPSASPSRPH